MMERALHPQRCCSVKEESLTIKVRVGCVREALCQGGEHVIYDGTKAERVVMSEM